MVSENQFIPFTMISTMNTFQRLPLSVVIITLNAERTLAQTLKSVNEWASEIVLVDSGSTDNTLDIAQIYRCRILHHHFDGFGTQKQFAIDQAANDWILLLDADETPDTILQASIQEILAENSDPDRSFSLPRSLIFMGKPLRHGGEQNKPVVRLFNRKHAHVTSALVHESIVSEGPVTMLTGTLWHDSYGSLHEYVAKMNHYTSLNAQQSGYLQRKQGPLDVFVRFIFKFVKVYVFKRSVLDGLPGFVWAFFSAVYPVLKYVKLYEQASESQEQAPEYVPTVIRTTVSVGTWLLALVGSLLLLYRFFRLISSTANLTARAVNAINVIDGFWEPVDVMQAPSVTNTFLQLCS